jgi:hypothetical protein
MRTRGLGPARRHRRVSRSTRWPSRDSTRSSSVQDDPGPEIANRWAAPFPHERVGALREREHPPVGSQAGVSSILGTCRTLHDATSDAAA